MMVREVQKSCCCEYDPLAYLYQHPIWQNAVVDLLGVLSNNQRGKNLLRNLAWGQWRAHIFPGQGRSHDTRKFEYCNE